MKIFQNLRNRFREWNPGLTKAQITQIERIQKCALAIILAEEYVCYRNALTVTGLNSLESRRHDLCLEFAKKAVKHPKFSHGFELKPKQPYNTRAKTTRLKPVICRTKRYEKSPIAYLTKLLNENQ